MTEAPRTLKLAEEAVLSIKEMIVAGRLGPGDRLPNEEQLRTELGISRNSLREAVRALSVMKVLDVRQGDGTYVTSLSPDLLLAGVALVADLLGDPWILEAFEVRRLLEPAATAVAAERVDDRQVAELQGALRAMEAAQTSEELNECDTAFHRVIVTATGNATLSSLIESLWGRTIRARVWRSIVDEGAVERTIGWHRMIVDAIVARDPDAARAADLLHLTESEHWLRHALAQGARGALGESTRTQRLVGTGDYESTPTS